MNQTLIQGINKVVYKRFPEMRDVRPTVRTQKGSTARDEHTYLLVYKTKIALAGSKSLPRTVRVIANDEGRVIRITTSR